MPFGLPKPKEWSEWGPDLVLLSVPAEDVVRISVYRCFWNLAGRVDIDAEVLEVHILMGTPAALGTINETYADLQITGLETRHARGEFDYLDYEIDLSFPVPRNFGGVSGGGVWQVYVYWSTSTGEVDWKMSLHGVAYYQLPIIAERTTIRCHGPQTIQATLAEATKASCQ